MEVLPQARQKHLQRSIELRHLLFFTAYYEILFLGEGIPIKTTSGVVSEISLAIVSFLLSMKYPLRIPAITTFGNRLRITSFNFSSVESLAPKNIFAAYFY